MDDYTKILPKMLSGDELVKTLSIVPKYEEVKNMDMEIFIIFQRLIHEPETIELIRNSKIEMDDLNMTLESPKKKE